MTRKISDKSAIVVRNVAKNDISAVASAAGAVGAPSPGAEEAGGGELCVVFLGSAHKQKLFNKLASTCQRFENHIQYKDTYYLGFNFAGQECTIELTDPGLAHTGAREMAIRKADAVILCYASHDAESFHRLASLSKDFDCRRQGAGNFPPTLLICDEDEDLVEDSEDQRSSSSEGYESSGGLTPASGSPPRRRVSMKRIELSNENPLPITSEQGRNMANVFGPQCEFLSMSISSLEDSERLIDDLVKRIRDPDSGAGSPTKRKTSRQDLRTAITARLRRRRSLAGGGASSDASAKLSVESEPGVSSSSDATDPPISPFRRVRQFAAFRSIPPIFRRRKAGKLPPAGSSIDTALLSPSRPPDTLVNRELESETTIIESGGVTKIHIFDNEPPAQRSRSALDLHIDGGRPDNNEPVTPRSQPSSPRFWRKLRGAGKNSPLSVPPAAAAAAPPDIVIVSEPSEAPLPTPPSRRGSGHGSAASAVCTIS